MSKEKYISIRKNVNGFSFANLGLFSGFGAGVFDSIHSLAILGIFEIFFSEKIASSAVGVYAAFYALFATMVGVFSTEILHWFTKTRLLYITMATLGACYAMMSFSVQPFTFVALDYVAQAALTLINILLPLFISDFSKGIGMEKLNARFHLWTNVGALFAPMFAMTIVSHFAGNYRMPFLAAGMIYFSGLLFFKHFGIVQPEKVLKRVNMRKTIRALRIGLKSFFGKRGMLCAYMVNFGFYAIRSMRLLYVPIVVIENGFSSETLGLVLSLGILPYIIIESFIGKFLKKYGIRIWLTLGFLLFAFCSFLATFVTGNALLLIFILWQIPGAFMESSHDLLFFNDMPRKEQARFYGIFRTSVNVPNIIAPILGAACIALFGTTAAVWIITGIVGILSTIILWSHSK